MLWPSDKEPHRCKARESRIGDCLCQLLSSILVKIKATQDIVFKYFALRKLPKVSGPIGLDTIRQYKQFSIMFFFVITHSLYTNEKQFAHSLQNVGRGMSLEVEKQGVCLLREAGRRKHITQ